MPKQLGDLANVGTAFQKMGGAGSAEIMGRELDTRSFTILGSQPGDRVFGEGDMAIADPKSVAGPGTVKTRIALLQISLDASASRSGERSTAVPAVLGVSQVEKTLFEVEGFQS